MRRSSAAVVIAFALALLSTGQGFAQPAIPAGRLFGAISLNGQNAPFGSVVVAYAGATYCGGTSGLGVYDGSQYFLDLNGGFSDCSMPGNSLTLTVNGTTANEVAYVPAVPGTAVQVNLSLGSNPYAPVYAPPYAPQQPEPATDRRCHDERSRDGRCHRYGGR